jgi:hypothetical protein
VIHFVLSDYLGQDSTRQGQCKPNAESSLYAEVQPVLAISIAKLDIKKRRRKKSVALRKFWKVFVKVWDFCESFDPY